MAQSALTKLQQQHYRHLLKTQPLQGVHWLASKAKKLKGGRDDLFKDKTGKAVTRFEIGRMYFYYYDPKTKATLPYYDKFPLVIPIEPYKDGFLGLNLHYLRPTHRAILLGKLTENLNNNKYDRTTKLRLNYGLLKSTTKYKEFAPCLKRYLFNHIQSKLILVDADEWHVAIALPFSDFHGAKETTVWKESRSKF